MDWRIFVWRIYRRQACPACQWTRRILGVDDFDITDLALIAPSIEKNDTSDLLLPTAQTFMIYGPNDEVIAPSSLQQFGENFGIQTHIIDDTGHFFHGKLGELKQLLEALSSK